MSTWQNFNNKPFYIFITCLVYFLHAAHLIKSSNCNSHAARFGEESEVRHSSINSKIFENCCLLLFSIKLLWDGKISPRMIFWLHHCKLCLILFIPCQYFYIHIFHWNWHTDYLLVVFFLNVFISGLLWKCCSLILIRP